MKHLVKKSVNKFWSPALKISLIYSVIAILWVLGADSLFAVLTTNIDALPYFEILKDVVLIFMTAIMLFLLVARQLSKEDIRHFQIIKYNNTLASLIKHPDFIKGDFNGMLNSLTRILSDVLDVNRVSIWKLNKTQTTTNIEALNLWESSKNTHTKGVILSSVDFPEYFKALLHDRTLTFDDVYSDFRTKEFTEEYFPANNICSMLDAPFHFAGEIAGVVCLEHTGEMRNWTIEEETFIISAADILSIVFESSQRKELELTLRRSEKMEALGKLTGGIAHDYNNMLGIIIGYCELLELSLKNQPELEKYIKSIYHASERGAKLTKKLLSFSRNKSTNSEVVNLNTLLKEEQHMLEKTLTARIELQLTICDDIWPIWVDSSDLEDSIINLCINAMHAIDGNGKLTLQTSNKKLSTLDAEALNLKPQDYVQLSVTDNGCGIEPSMISKIFEPFFSTKGDKGTGLGLSQVYGFVERSHGTIKVDSKRGHGTCITIYFPRHAINDTPDNEVKVKNKNSTDLRGNETILVVDDEIALLDLTSELLLQQGYHVLRAESAEQALDILKNNAIDLLLSDVIMSEMNGYQLASIVKKTYPSIKIQLVSGFVDVQNIDSLDDELQEKMLHKPFKSDELLQAIQRLLHNK